MDRKDVARANQLLVELKEFDTRPVCGATTPNIRLEVLRSWSTIYVGGQAPLKVGEIGDDKVMTAEQRPARGLRDKALEYYDEKIADLQNALRLLGVEASEAA